MKVYDQLAWVVAAEKPGACFALLGDANMAFAQRLGEAGVRMVYVRHEHCAAAAAMAHARKTGEPGLVTVTCGPGLTQLMTALPAAVRARLPMVVVAGEAPLKSAWYNQAIDQAPFVTATGAAYVPLHTPARIPQGVRDAFLQARRERRPVVVGIPFDLQEAAWEGDARLPEPSHAILPRPAPMPPNPDDVARAAAAVAEARRVVVMAGLGAVEAGAAEACKALAEATGGLLAETLPARGIFHDDPFNLGVAGGFSSDIARECFAEADLVIAVGCSLAWHNAAGGKLWPKARVLQIDTDPVAVSQGRRAAQMHLRADARLGAEALAAALPPRAGTPWRSAALARRIATEPLDGARFEIEPGTIDPREAVAALDAAIPRGWQLVNSSGHCSYWTAQMRGRPNAEFLTIREFGAIGNGISFAIGVAVARPGAPVVLFDGDGSLLMHVQELETILRHDLPVMIVVFNDGGYGSEFHKLRAHGLGEAGAHFGRTDLASIARGFGAEGARIENAADIAAHVARFAENPRPTVLDLAISERVMSPVIRRAHGTAAKSA
ncbi:Acetolactate synthase large subunit [Meinhardsimonia xiamenensis]|jgi:thiamine pyrophosphate-dependent acetolactate synthase large subunit-like protein|uniref:Acetolactate synthase large subunit n=1 Tax=Meinhardsimonia xiamenensis TaxID=990712 RepID=A0A1G9C9I4_9RHOB|nr:thiamine pyrophosphate-dependent enzyme [Meinhardsimonia xiamenensis]PRX38443.1 thiamine pyrophosphate-dependent acetolactate synthase large subunit-like protein [Meinhardsimonia xiamenensis]SDK48309.1 Acetolactate synthase large subunit [Meinhardsimonia xiamenensis]